jgi:hypothetical protein
MANSLSSTLTYDQANPHRPTIAEFGGGAFQDDPIHPPDASMHPSAGMFNQATKQIVALAGMTPSLKIQVEFVAGVPTITQLVALGTKITASQFQALGGQVIDNGNGDTTILVPLSLIPTQLTRASGLTIVEDVEIDRKRIVIDPGNGGFRIKTKLGATGTDAAFTFQVN